MSFVCKSYFTRGDYGGYNVWLEKKVQNKKLGSCQLMELWCSSGPTGIATGFPILSGLRGGHGLMLVTDDNTTDLDMVTFFSLVCYE